jgi:hypothetical protein
MRQKGAVMASAVEREEIADRVVRGRAFEAVVWGMPVVSFELMYQAMRQAGGGFNQVVYWPGLPDWKNQTLTPNPDAIYLMPFTDTTDAGPVVLEIPPADDGSITGTVMDCWQAAIEDVGPAGADRGTGGRYLILPPGHTGALPPGYIPMPSDTYSGFALLRSILRSGSDSDVAQAVAYGRRIRLYPLAQAADPPPTVFADASGVVFDATIPYDRRFFASLDRMIQREPWLTRDKAMIDIVKSAGIEKGRPFEPDAATREILDQAAADAHAWLDARYETIFTSGFYPRSQWALPVSPEMIQGQQTFFADPGSYPVDDRGVSYSMAFFSPKHSGAGSFYLMAIKDHDGLPLDGRNTYRLTVPPRAPVTQYWSATIYDRATHSLIRDTPRSSRSSQSPDLTANADGSTDIYFGPDSPAGKHGNWVPTRRDGFEVLFRFYGPQPPLFNKTWQLPDITKLT